MPQITPTPAGSFTLYVEGARDRSILQAWASRLMPIHARRLLRSSVILGGRQPARALDHFRASGTGGRALCVLDRDDGVPTLPSSGEHGIEFFMWSRRHIESYLLVPAAIRRALRLAEDDKRLDRLFDGTLPEEGDESAWCALNAKRMLGPNGAVPSVLGRTLSLTRIARVTRESELHSDVHMLFDRLKAGFGAPRASQIRPVR